MVRAALPIETARGVAPLTPETITFTSANVADGNSFTFTGREVLLVFNDGASTRTITFQTIAVNGRQDPLHNSAQNITAGQYLLYGPFTRGGFRQDDGLIYVSANHAEVKFCVIKV
jgi:hypothetical protein